MTDLEVMKNDRCWGLWPYLPIKRFVGNSRVPECCLLWASRVIPVLRLPVEQQKFPVYNAFVYKLPPTKEEFLATKKYEYNSLEEIVADGWIIDD